jgi:hypothetical protein
MPAAKDIGWFKQQFNDAIARAVRGTPYSVDMLTAIACQETGYIWEVLRTKNLSVDRILELCVGDTLDYDKGRRAFPQTKDQLVAKQSGGDMFAIAHQALVDMAKYVPGYQAVAQRANKFCHGFGIFQYDIQHFLTDPDYFLEKRYADFDACLKKCIEELDAARARIGWKDKTALSDLEMAGVAIAYNSGRYTPSKGLKQGHFNGSKYYGEAFFDFLRLSKTVPAPGAPAPAPLPQPDTAPLPEPTPVAAAGAFWEVDTRISTLRLRREPEIDAARPTANVIGELPDGHIVRAVSDRKVNGFLEVETSLNGAHLQGFASAKYLKPAPGVREIEIASPQPAPPGSGIVEVYMPHAPGAITRRTGIAGPHSLNEPGQPTRKGTTPDELRASLASIIDWLAVDRPAHARYKPRSGFTFCNIYAHDYCTLAGVYLPRVWWTPAAVERLARGETVEPKYGSTIDEQRANDLFRWLRDFGLRFGWRQTGTLTKLQQEANQGAIGLIVARRREDGKSGHIVAVVPETEEHRARRDTAGEVTAPLQSQAGASNFRYSTGTAGWWKGAQFAESAFWLHG